MSDSRIKRPRVVLVSYAKEDHDKLPALMQSLAEGGIRDVLALGETREELNRRGFRVRGCAGSYMNYLTRALRDADRYKSYGLDMPSIDMLCVTFTNLLEFADEFGSTNDTQDQELILPEDLERVSLVLSACAGRRVVIAGSGWERGIRIDLVEARTESDAWIAGRIREATQRVHAYVGMLVQFQKQFADRMSCLPRMERPSKNAMCTCGAPFFRHTDSGVDMGAACHSFTPKK